MANKILITGSSGTIGTRLFETMLENGYKVVGFDRKINKWRKDLDKLTMKGDLTLKENIEKIPKDIDLIIHLAANARVYDLVQDPNLALENVITTYNVLEFARKNNVKKIIFAGSREAYGNRDKAVAKEEDARIELSESPYAASKISNESFVCAYSKCYGIDHVILRFSNVYGMYDESDRFVPLMIRKMKKNEDILIFGRDKVLDFTYIDDCIVGILKAVKSFSKVKNNTFNITYGKGSNLVEVAKEIKKLLKSKSTIIIKKNRLGEVEKFIGNVVKSKKYLDYKPRFAIKKGLKLSVAWYNRPTY